MWCLQCVDMRDTAPHTIGEYFTAGCSRFNSVVLPDTILDSDEGCFR